MLGCYDFHFLPTHGFPLNHSKFQKIYIMKIIIIIVIIVIIIVIIVIIMILNLLAGEQISQPNCGPHVFPSGLLGPPGSSPTSGRASMAKSAGRPWLPTWQGLAWAKGHGPFRVGQVVRWSGGGMQEVDWVVLTRRI